MEKEIEGKVIDINDQGEVIDSNLILRFNKPYEFEGKTYNEVDLSGLENMTAKDMIETQKVLDRSGTFSVIPEMSVEYACIIASRATHHPIEFFKGMPMKEAVKLKNRVTSFFYGTD